MRRTLLNDDWSFRLRTSSFTERHLAVAEWTEVTLPHDAIWTLPRSAEAPDAGRVGFFPGGAFEPVESFDQP